MGLGCRSKCRGLFQVVGACLLLAACAPLPTPSTQVALPTHWREGPAAASLARQPDLHSWWTAFGDARLNRLVARALAHNLSLAQARARLKSATYRLDDRQHRFYPTVQAGTQNAQPPNTSDAYFQFGLDASWELGLFGRGQAVLKQALGAVDEAEANRRSVRVALVAEVAAQYLQLGAAQRQAQHLQRLIQLDREREHLLQTRIRLGLTANADLASLRADMADVETQALTVQSQVQRHAQNLAVLLGQAEPDAGWFQPEPLPAITPPSPALLPADLLRTRPDIQQAQAQVLQAAGDLGIAHADRYPQVSLEGGILWSTNLSRYHSGWPNFRATPLLGPVINIPLFDWGRRKAEENARGALLRAAAFAYRDTVLKAVADVENAFAGMTTASRQVSLREQALQAQTEAANAEQGLVKQGLASPLEMLRVERLKLEAESRLDSARDHQALAFVTLYQAFGGPPLPQKAGGA